MNETKTLVKSIIHKTLALLLVIVLLFGYVPVLHINGDGDVSVQVKANPLISTAYAADLTATGSLTVANAGYLTVTAVNDNSIDTGSVTLSGNTVKATAKGYATGGCNSENKASTTTVTLKNTSAGNMTVTCLASDGSTLSETSPITLASGESFTYTVKSGDGASSTVTGTLTISSIELAAANYTTTFAAATNGSYTVTRGGEARTVGQSYTEMSDVPYILSATPNSGYKFYAWVDGNGSPIGTTQNGFSYTPASNATIKPAFIKTDSATYALKSNLSKPYFYLDDAINAAGSSGTIVVMSNGTVYGSSGQTSFTIPKNVTLLIPMDEVGTIVTNIVPTRSTTAATPYRTLTMANGTNLTINGTLDVAAKIYSMSGGDGNGNIGGRPVGGYGLINMNSGSSITLSSGGKLYCYGFITGSGSITAKNGSEVHEVFQITEHRGGTNMSNMRGKSVFPFSQYYVHNIEAPLNYEYGSKEILHTDIYGGGGTNSVDNIPFLGSSSSLFILNSDTTATKTYIPAEDRVVIDIYGNAQLDAIAMDLGLISISSSDYVLPINGDITIHIHSGTTTVKNNTELLPGAKIIVDQGAYLEIASGKTLFVYDSVDWVKATNGFSKGFVYNNIDIARVSYRPGGVSNRALTDSVIDVNGTISVTGQLNTTKTGAGISSSEGSGIIIFVTKPSVSTLKQVTDGATIVDVTSTAAQLKNGDGSYTATAGSAANTTFSYCATCDKWEKEPHSHGNTKTDPVAADFTVSNNTHTYDGTVKAATVTGKDGMGAITVEYYQGTTKVANPTNAGIYTIKVSVAESDSYNAASGLEVGTLTITAATMTVTAEGYTGTYDGQAHSIKVTAPEGAAVTYCETENGEYTSENPIYTNVGNYKVYYKVEKANYTTVPGSKTVTINKATVAVLANAQSKTYGEADPELTYTANGLVGTDKLTGALTREAGENVGTYAITQGTLTAGDNYTISYTGANLTINKAAASVTTAPTAIEDLTYNGEEQELVNKGTASGGTMQYSLDGTNYSDAIPTGTAAGTYTVYYKVVGDANHNDTEAVSITVTIAKAVSGATAEGFNGIYDGQAHSISVTAPEGVAVKYSLQENGVFTTENPEFTDVGTYTVYYKVESDNFESETGSTSVTITPKSVTVSGIIAENKVYDGTAIATLNTANAIFDGIVSGDTLTVTAAGAFDDANVGENKNVTISNLELGGESAKNYALSAEGNQTTATASITAAELSGVRAEDVNVTYDGQPHSIQVEIPNDAVVTYSLEENGVYMPKNPAFTNAGTYTVFYKVEKANYISKTGSATVKIDKAAITPFVTLEGWACDENANEPVVSGNPGDGDVTFTYAVKGSNEFGETVPTEVGEYTVKATIAETTNYLGGEATADFTIVNVPTFTITWKDGDGKTLKTEPIARGETPVYTGDTPTKTATAQYSYTFNDTWSPEIVPVTGDATYTAQFDSTVNKYTITWVDGDGNTLKTEQVAYGGTPAYTGDTPTKTATAQYSYTFNNTWSPEIVDVTSDATYTAQFDSTVNEYEITATSDGHGTVTLSNNVVDGKAPYGSKVTFKATPESDDYEFSSWTDAGGAVVSTDAAYTLTVTGDVSLKANFKLAFEPVAKIEGKFFRTLDAAVDASKSGDVIVLLKSVEQSTDLTIPSGVTLLLPYAPGEETINPDDPNNLFKHPYANEHIPEKAAFGMTEPGNDVNVTLTMADGKKLIVKNGGMLVVGASLTGDQPVTGTTYGLHSEITLGDGASIEIANGAILSNCGYITGGTVNAHGFVYEPFVMTDFHGGTVLMNRLQAGNTPFNSFALMNIQSDLVIYDDGALQGYAMVNSGDTQYCASALTIGQTDNGTGLFVLGEGTTLTISYDAQNTVDTYGIKVGKTTFTVEGNVTFTPMTISLMGRTLSTDMVTFGIPYNIDMVQKSGCFTIKSKAAVLPGSTITVKEGASAKMEAGSILLVLDEFTPKKEGGKPTYPAALNGQRGNLFIDGTLTIEDGATFGGVAQTHGTGKIVVGENATLEGAFTAGGGDNVTTYDMTAQVAMLHKDGNKLYEMADLAGDEVTYYGIDAATVVVDELAPVTGTWGIDVDITLNANYSETPEKKEIKARIGVGTTLPENPFTREGYTFAGWTADAEGIGEKLTAYTPTIDSDCTVYAQWTVNTYTVTFKVDGEAYGEAIQVAYGEEILLPEVPTKEGYTFSGWQDVPETMPAHDVTITGSFTVNQYTITFNTDGGSEIAAITQDYGTAVTAPADPTKEGYTFAGWEPAIPETMPAQNMTITAKWTVNQYTITFNTDGGSEIAAITQDYGTAVTAPADPTKEGYTFAGWDKEIPATMPAQNMTITAKWTVNQYTITFNTDGGSEIAAITQDYGTAVTAPADPTKEGYTFAGWEPAIPATMPSENMTITAKWTVNQYTITFNTDGGSEIAAITQDYGTAVTAPADPTKEGYTFAGWDKEIPATMPAENVTITAKWTINQYTVTVETDGNGTATASATTADYGTEITVTATPSYAGYVFDKWTVNGETVSTDATYKFTLTENVTLKANFKLSFDPVAKIGNNYYGTLDAAVEASNSGDVIVLLKDWTQESDVTIPGGVTLLLPYAAGEETINGADAQHPYANEAIVNTMQVATVGSKTHVTLTMGDNAKLTVSDNAKLVVGGTLGGNHPIAGATVGKHSEITLGDGASIVVANGAILSNCGYITGGTVNVSGMVYEPFVVTDYHGGTVLFNRVSAHSSPFNSYVIMNTQSNMVLDPAAELHGYVMIYAAGAQQCASITAVGSNSLFELDNGTLTIRYSETNIQTVSNTNIGKTTFEIEGDVSFNPIKLEYASYSIDMQNVIFTIPYSMELIQKSGTFTVNADAVILPGTMVTVAEGANAVVASGHKLFVADEFVPANEGGMATYPAALNDQRGNLFIDGTLTIEDGATFGGVAQTHGTGKIVVGESATLEGRFTAGGGSNVTSYDVTGQVAMLYKDGNKLFEMADLAGDEVTYYGIDAASVVVDELAPVTGTWGIDVDITLNANYSETPATQDVKARIGVETPLPENPFTREGYTFAGWTTDAAGTGEKLTTYTPTIDSAWTVYAQWTVNTYTVTFKVDGEAYGEAIQVAYGEEILLPEVPTKEGYTFSGWQDVPETMPAHDVTITGSFTVNQYTITFDTDGGSEIAPITQDYGTAVTAPADPTKEGYTFAGWDKAIPATMPAENVTITAKWTVNQYTITFDTDGGSEIAPITQDYGTAVTAPADPTKEGYTFIGWDKEIPATMPAENVTITAKWTVNQYTITFDTDGGSEIAPITQDYGTAVTAPADPTKEGYTFIGWDKEIPATMPAENMTIKAQWTVNTYTVTFTVDGEAYGNPIQVVYGEEIPLPAEPTKEGYTFSGWQGVPETMPAHDVTITGVFGINSYTIRWMNGDTVLWTETVVHGATPEYKGETPTKAPTNTEVFTFTGWDPKIVAATQDQDYTAQFSSETRTYTITWVIDGVTTTEQYEYGQTPTHEEPKKEGDAQFSYTFTGWTPEIAAVTEDATYTAQFSSTLNTYTVTWVDGNGEPLKTETVDYGTKPAYTGETPTKTSTEQYHYTFTGWDPEITDETIVTGDVTYTAQFKEVLRQYTVTFYDEDGKTVLESKLWDYGTMPSCSETPTKEGDNQYSYIFTGWTPEITEVTGDAAYTAQFTSKVNTYTVTWVDGNGNTLKTETMDYGTKPTYTGETPTKTSTEQYHYTFTGWDPEITDETIVTGDVTYTAQFEEVLQQYTVTFYDEDGKTVLQSGLWYYGVMPSYSGTAPTKERTDTVVYAFSGWTPAVVPVSSDATYTAVFTSSDRLYTVQWLDEDGTRLVEDQTNVRYDDTLTYPGTENPTKAGNAQYSYDFSGWTRTVEENVITMRATYSQRVNTYTVIFYDEDGKTILDQQTVEYGTKPTYSGEMPAKPATDQYTYSFAGWNPAITDETIVTSDVTYTATYNQMVNTYTVTWADWDGTVLETDTDIPYGTYPTYDSSEPSREQTVDKVYTFIGWYPEIADVTGNVTYTAQYEETDRLYTVTWMNWNGDVLQVDQVKYNDPVPAFVFTSEDGEDLTPVKNSTAQYCYTFDKFTPEVEEGAVVMENMTFTAQFTEELRSYVITWKLDENTVIDTTTVAYGETPTHADPTKADTDQYTYTFTGWDPKIVPVTGEATYTAQFTETLRTYTVIWKNWNGDVLETDENVLYGTAPSYDSANPTRALAENEDGVYTFKGWDPALTDEMTVTGDTEFTATFTFTGWRTDANGKQYFKDDEMQTGWLELDGKSYYLDEETGYAATGLTEIPASDGHDAGKYLFDESGAFRSEFDGVYADEKTGNTYLLKDGVVIEYSGLYRDPDTEEYYFFQDNVAIKDQNMVISAENNNGIQNNLGDTLPDDTYFFGSDGKIAHEKVTLDGIQAVDGVKYYYIDGIRVYMGMFEQDGDYYYADSDGKLIVDRTYWCTRNNDTGFAEGPYSFDEEGRMIIVPAKNGLYEEEGDMFYYVDGTRSFAGLVKVDAQHPLTIHYADGTTAPAADGYYYVMSNGQLVQNRYFWVSKTNDTGFEAGVYFFDEDGKLQIPEKKNGIYAEDGTLFYYEDDVRTGKGLMQIAENTVLYVKADGTESKAAAGYYYILPDGEVVHGRSYWVSTTNGLLQEGSYTFDEDGKMVAQQQKSGIVSENGKLYYYENGVRTFGGLMLIDGNYYYAKADGEIVCGKSYYVSKTNGLLPAGVYQFDADGRMVTNP